MCGIAGYFQVAGLDGERGAGLLRRMNQIQQHRGPDGEGLFYEEAIGLGHRRLAVIDLADGQQPMASADGRYVLVYNGEVYNYRVLRSELTALGHKFRTESDSEVVLEAFSAWGTACFNRFNGMWGLAVYDRWERRLTLSRDHFGIKPLYYSIIEQGNNGSSLAEGGTGFGAAGKSTGIIFASEITPLIESGLIPKQPDDRTIYRYLRFRVHDDGQATFFKGVQKLLPGEMLTLEAAGLRIEQYSTLRADLLRQDEIGEAYNSEAARKYRHRLEESVRLRLQSDVPVGTSLSGGLDSSTVAVLISELMSARDVCSTSVGAAQNVFSAVFPNQINDEERYVDAAVEVCQADLKVHKVKPTADEFKQDILDFIRSQEEPLISTGPYAQFQVMREAAKYVTVLLDGQGADETMAGYVPYYAVYLRELKRKKRYGKLVVEFACALDVLLRLARFRIADRLRLRKNRELSGRRLSIRAYCRKLQYNSG